jgi:hypothetical protein
VRAWSEYLTYLRSPATPTNPVPTIDSVDELEAALRAALPTGPTALLLSGGIDSHVLRALLPDATCYTAQFDDLPAETPLATPVPITWGSYLKHHDDLVRRKGYALTGVEPAVHELCRAARADGFTTVVSGLLADAHFGDVGRLHASSDPWRAYLRKHVDPTLVLREPIDVRGAARPYLVGGRLDTPRFTSELAWGDGPAFDNAAALAGVRHVAPFGAVRAAQPVAGKPLVAQLYERLTGARAPRSKNGFARPMGRWLSRYAPKRREFRPLPALNPARLFYVWSLERWMNL